jgi:co-chaperonin GroES (HSP10)
MENMKPNRGMVLLEVLPEESYDSGIGMKVAYTHDVSPNCIVKAVGDADLFGAMAVAPGDRVFVPTSGSDQLELDGKTHAVVHQSRIRLIWKQD